MQEFFARIHKFGILPCVDAPPEVSQALGKRGHVPAKGFLNGRPIQANLLPIGAGRHRLFINGKMRRAALVGVGDEVSIALEFDPAPRELPVPDDLRKALRQVKGAQALFEALPLWARRYTLQWITDAKRPETRAQRIETLIVRLMKRVW